ncbi:MAG TPA: hypothetical protein VKD43_05285 [Xanthobacteraceae bacterium]|nr:hypothetical protein [Xanthobacteraceae bacterium]
MTLSRAWPLLLALAAMPPSLAAAQFGGAPGSPPALEPPVGAAPATPPPACQQILRLREEVQKHAQALQAAGKRKALPEELCELFKTYLAAESRMIAGLDEHWATCGVPSYVSERVKSLHQQASQVGKSMCEQAAAKPLRIDKPFRIEAPAPADVPPRSYAPAPQCTEKTLISGVPCVD